ncbi:MAG: adenylate kinase [Spirochaetes bacterium]|nr:adenylate kinase [Spirochaetota bacterium]
MNLILLGAPGAGKGTVSKSLVEKKQMVQISTGDILRNEIKNGSSLGIQAKKYIDAGDLVPDELILGIVESRLNEDDCKNGFILDGFPRTVSQAEGLKKMLIKNSFKIRAAADISVPEEILIQRLSSRRTCSNVSCQAIYNVISKPPKTDNKCDLCGSELIQRSDETEDAIRHRLEIYTEKTAPLISFYSQTGEYVKINGNQDIDSVVNEVLNVIK